jgi:hypothetical protein
MNCFFHICKLFNVVHIDKIHPKYYFVFQYVAIWQENNKRKARLTKYNYIAWFNIAGNQIGKSWGLQS